MSGRISTDSRDLDAGDLFVAITGERHDGNDFVAGTAGVAAAAVVASGRAEDVVERVRAAAEPARPGFGLIVVDDTLAALERLATWHRRRLGARVIAVTGSYGKTTVKEFIGQVLAGNFETVRARKSFNNRLGVALTLLDARRSTRFVVAELGTNAPGEIASLAAVVSPETAVVSAIGEAHLEGLGDLDGVAREKSAIFTALPPGGLAFLPDPVEGEATLVGAARHAGATLIRIGHAGGTSGAGYRIARCTAITVAEPGAPPRPGHLFELDNGRAFELPVPGRHNVMNALFAIAVGREAGLDWPTLQERVRRLTQPPLRLALSCERGVTLIDDTYNANPGSLRAALDTVAELGVAPGGRWFLVLGDLLELGDRTERIHAEIGDQIARLGLFDRMWTVGDAARTASAAASAGGLASRALDVGDAPRVVEELLETLRPGDGVLLKGSRGVGLDRIAELLRRGLATADGPFDVYEAEVRRAARAALPL